MNKKPVKVRLVGKKGKTYQIKFPYLKTLVSVNANLYLKMLHSSEYEFSNSNVK